MGEDVGQATPGRVREELWVLLHVDHGHHSDVVEEAGGQGQGDGSIFGMFLLNLSFYLNLLI